MILALPHPPSRPLGQDDHACGAVAIFNRLFRQAGTEDPDGPRRTASYEEDGGGAGHGAAETGQVGGEIAVQLACN